MEMGYEMPTSEEDDEDGVVSVSSLDDVLAPDISSHNDPKKCVSYWSGKFMRHGPFPASSSIIPDLQNVACYQTLKPYSYDVHNDIEGPFPETCAPADMFEERFQLYKEKGLSLSDKEVTRLFDNISPRDSQIDRYAAIEKMFSDAFVPYVSIGRDLTQKKNPDSFAQMLQLRTAYNAYAHGSCLFRCIDFCLGGNYTIESNECSRQDAEDIVYAHVNEIKKKFVSAILSRLDAATSSQEQADLMQTVVNSHDFDLRYAEKYASMSEDEFVSHVLAHDASLCQVEELKRMHQSGTFVIDVACNIQFFRQWLMSSLPLSAATSAQYQLAKSNGALGFLLPPGYFNEWTEGGEYELSLIPHLFARQVVLIDADGALPEAGFGLRCSKTHTPAHINAGPLSVLVSLSVYTSQSTNAYLQSRHSVSTDDLPGPMILMRSAGHYTVQTPTDRGVAMLNVLSTSCIYNLVRLLYSERKDYITRIFMSLPLYNEREGLPPVLLPLVGPHLTPHQRLIITFLTYEKGKYQVAFCKALLKIPCIHTESYLSDMKSKIAQLTSQCKFETPFNVIAERSQ